MLDDYLESVREIERRVQKMEANDLSHIQLPDAPVGIPNKFEDQMNLMFDTVALAWQANLTRITTFMMAAEVSNMTFNQIDVPDAFHALSHHQNNGPKLERLQKVQTYNTKIVRALRAEARRYAGRRRLAARSLDPSVRQQHEQQQRARPFPAAGRGARRRLRQAQGRPARALSAIARRTRTSCSPF